MFIRNPYDLLLEAAGDDLTANTEGCITENAIHESLNSIEEVDEDIVIAPNMVPVIRVSESYLVEMQAIASFMKSNGITSTEKALDAVAEANNLMPKEVGLLIESDDYVDNINTSIYNKFLMSKLILEKNYYKIVLKNVTD